MEEVTELTIQNLNYYLATSKVVKYSSASISYFVTFLLLWQENNLLESEQIFVTEQIEIYQPLIHNHRLESHHIEKNNQ